MVSINEKEFESRINNDIDKLFNFYSFHGRIGQECVFKEGLNGLIYKGLYDSYLMYSEKLMTKGLESGMLVLFFDNGKPEIEIFYEYGKRHGKCRSYSESGEVIIEEIYENGIIKEYTK